MIDLQHWTTTPRVSCANGQRTCLCGERTVGGTTCIVAAVVGSVDAGRERTNKSEVSEPRSRVDGEK
jgi:hypothetical protein